MRAIEIDGATRNLGKPRNWDEAKDGPCVGLPVRDAMMPGGWSCMISAWRPTREELARLNAGAAVELCIVGTTHPPVSLNVGDVPAIVDFPAEAIGAAIREAVERDKAQAGDIPPGTA